MLTKERTKFLKTIPDRQRNLRDGLVWIRKRIHFCKTVMKLTPWNYECASWRVYKNECRADKAIMGAIKKQLPARPAVIEIYPDMGAVRFKCNCGRESVFGLDDIICYCPYCGQKQDTIKIKEAKRILQNADSEAAESIGEDMG